MLNKIKRFLLRQKGMKFLKASEKSVSQYFEINGYKIRISDHVSPLKKDELNIITTMNEEFIVSYDGRCMTFPSYRAMRDCIKSFILITTFAPIVIQEVTKEIPVYVPKESGLTEDEARFLRYYRGIKPSKRANFIGNLQTQYLSKESRKYRKSLNIPD